MSQIIITSPASGGASVKTYGSFYDTTIQTQTLANTNVPVTFNTQDLNGGIDLPTPSQIQVHGDGVYNMTFSIQFTNSNVQTQDANVFLKKNGNFLDNSNSKISIHSSHGGVDGALVLTVNFFLELIAEDYIELYWNATSTDVKIYTIPVVPIPPAGFTPQTPSVILTINQI